MSVVDEAPIEGTIPIQILELDPPKKLLQQVTNVDIPNGVIGDCWSTCIAALCGAYEPKDVPNFMQILWATGKPLEDWRSARHWLREDGLDLAAITLDDAVRIGCYYIAEVQSRRGDWKHAVIFKGKEFYHCPSGIFEFRFDEITRPLAEVLTLPYDIDPDQEQIEYIMKHGEEVNW